jgi:PAS domain S-box-containing protein
MQSIFRAAPVGIGLVMPERIIADVNDHLCDMLGYYREELIGNSTRMLYPSDEVFDHVGREKYRKIEETGRIAMETRFKRKDGGIIDILLSSSYIDPYNASAGITLIAMDITARKRADERLRTLNQSFLSLGADPLENMQKLALTCKDILRASLVRYGRKERGVFYIFSSMRTDDGFVRHEEVDEHLCGYIGSAGLSGIITTENLEGGAFEHDPDVRRHGLKSGLLHSIYVHGEYVGTLCAFAKESRAFTRVEKDSLATLGRAIGIEEERRAFNERLRDFVDIASHELRHPVTLLAGYAQTLEEQGAEMDGETRDEVAGAIRHGTERLNRLVASLLDISLVERERFFISRRRENIVSLLEEAVGEMRQRAPDRILNLRTSSEVVEGDVDAIRLHSLMMILLDNALQYSPKDTEIDVSLEATRDEALISVLDRGTGVPAEHREKIFERFHQVEEAQYHSKPGMGLGLFLAGQIVEGHGGRIWYEPREGGGSAFRFTLPLP